MAGLFISFEGGDGAGKSTQVRALAQWISEQGFAVTTTREPGGTELGAQIRQMLLEGGAVSPRAEALLYAADRAHHIATKVRPALERGDVVISDRYFDSSVAYQGAARALPKEQVRALSLWAVENLLPDLTILLDLPVENGAVRVGAEQDRIEAEGVQFHQNVRAEFLHLAQAEPNRIKVIDGSQSIEEIAQQVRELVAPLLTALQQNESLAKAQPQEQSQFASGAQHGLTTQYESDTQSESRSQNELHGTQNQSVAQNESGNRTSGKSESDAQKESDCQNESRSQNGPNVQNEPNAKNESGTPNSAAARQNLGNAASQNLGNVVSQNLGNNATVAVSPFNPEICTEQES